LLLRSHGFKEPIVVDTGGKEPTGMGSSGSDLAEQQPYTTLAMLLWSTC
jgi:hypothetical protein